MKGHKEIGKDAWSLDRQSLRSVFPVGVVNDIDNNHTIQGTYLYLYYLIPNTRNSRIGVESNTNQ